jgi:AraC-like DNA-binding protein
VNKSLPLERTIHKYWSSTDIPVEYQALLLPDAGIYFRQDAECDILSQHLLLGPFSVWMHDILAKDNILIRSYTPIPVFTLQFMFEDSLAVPKAGYTLDERECSGFYLFPGQLHRIPMAADKKIFSFHINIQPVYMGELEKKYPQLKEMMHGVHPKVSARINSRPYHVNAVCDMLIRRIMTCRYAGLAGRYFKERCVTDILLNFANQHADSLQPFLYSSMLHADSYHNLFTYLGDHPHKNHSLPYLSYMYNIPLEEIDHGFRQHFAISIAEYTHMVKMMMVWHLIYEKDSSFQDIVQAAGFKDTAEMRNQMMDWFNYDPLLK